MFVFRSGCCLLVVFVATNTTNKQPPSSFFLFAHALKRKKRTEKRKNPTLLVRKAWLVRSWYIMGELEKILIMINRWGYLNIEQVALLTQKSFISAKRILERNLKKGFYKIDQHTTKNIYYLSHKGNSFVGREHKKAIKINCYELPHQDMLIKWLVAQTDIVHYQTERELKMENWKLRAYPNLLVYKNDDSEIYVEFDNTRKTPIRIRNKIINYKDWLNNGNKVHWVATNKTLSNWKQKQIIELNLYVNQHTYEIWEPNLDKKV